MWRKWGNSISARCCCLIIQLVVGGEKCSATAKSAFHSSCWLWETIPMSIYWRIQVCDSKQLCFVPRRVFVGCHRRHILLTVKTPVFTSWVEADFAGFCGIVSLVIMEARSDKQKACGGCRCMKPKVTWRVTCLSHCSLWDMSWGMENKMFLIITFKNPEICPWIFFLVLFQVYKEILICKDTKTSIKRDILNILV